jgi:site-specific recombinase XerD
VRVQRQGERWRLVGAGADRLALLNEFLGYLDDRNYSPRTGRAYAFDLLYFGRWLLEQGVGLDDVTSEVLLRYLADCRSAMLPGRHGGNVVSIRDGRSAGYAPATINRGLVAISGLFDYRAMRDPSEVSPVPRGPARRAATGERSGLLGHLARPRPRSRLRVREPKRLPRALDQAEIAALLASFRSERDRAIAGLMLFSGLRSQEVLSLGVRDVDIARGWLRVHGKGDKERRVPLDPDVASLVQTYLLVERPESEASELFLVAKGPHRGRPLTRRRPGCAPSFPTTAPAPASRPHTRTRSRHSFGTALAEAGVDLAVLQALLGHDHVDSAAVYIHLAPAHVRSAYDAARTRQRTLS